MWSHFKENQTIMKYMPDYENNELPERGFFFEILSTLYPREWEELIKAAYKARSSHYSTSRDEMVELTEEVKKEIDSIVSYKSML